MMYIIAPILYQCICPNHDDVIQWKHFRVTGLLYGKFTGDRWIPRTKASDAELCAWINGWVNNRESGDLKRHRVHYDVTVMTAFIMDSRHPYLLNNDDPPYNKMASWLQIIPSLAAQLIRKENGVCHLNSFHFRSCHISQQPQPKWMRYVETALLPVTRCRLLGRAREIPPGRTRSIWSKQETTKVLQQNRCIFGKRDKYI